MSYSQSFHHRRSIRLKGYDYSQAGWYFITICTQDMLHLFGEISNGKMILNEMGQVVADCWLDLPNHYQNVVLDEFVIMPNHFHGIVVFTNTVGTIGFGGMVDGNVRVDDSVGAIHELPLHEPPLHETSQRELPKRKPYKRSNQSMDIKQRRNMGLPKLVGRLKMVSSKQINIIRNTPGVPVWQRNYYEHIIRNEPELNHIREYIINNPLNWQNDNYLNCLITQIRG